MDRTFVSISTVLLLAMIYAAYSKEMVHETDVNTFDDINRSSYHQTQKRSILNEDGVIAKEEEIPNTEDDLNKRSSLFRFGKRGGSLFRFGKRGSLFRFGKRQGGTLFRFGKRGGTLFRFGRSRSADSPMDYIEDKRILSRFDKGSDRNLLTDALAEYEYRKTPYLLEDVESKRGIDSFHWGSES